MGKALAKIAWVIGAAVIFIAAFTAIGWLVKPRSEDASAIRSLRIGLVASLVLSFMLLLMQVCHELATAKEGEIPRAMWKKIQAFGLDFGLVLFTSAGSAFFGAGAVFDGGFSKYAVFIMIWVVAFLLVLCVQFAAVRLRAHNGEKATGGSEKMTFFRIAHVIVGSVCCAWVAMGATT